MDRNCPRVELRGTALSDRGELSLVSPTSDRLPWIRKRDGSVVPFDAAKLASSIYAARREVDEEDAAFFSQEQSQAVLHFLAEELEGRIPTTAEITEVVTKVLRELGQGPTAAAYYDYWERRRSRRERLKVHEEGASPPPADDPTQLLASRPQAFDKTRIAWGLENDADLDPQTAREVAAEVERKLIACGLVHISTGLIREMIECELLDRGIEHALARRRFLGVPAGAIEATLASTTDPDQVYRWAGRELLRQYALREVFSPDIAGLHEDGLLYLFDASCPIHWAAASADLRGVAARSTSVDSFLREFENELDEVCRRVEGTVAIDGPDTFLALLAERGTDPTRLAELVVDVFRRAVTRHETYLVVNLRGRVSDLQAAGLADAPMFRIRPEEAHDRFAAKFALRCAERTLEDPSLATRTRIDYHPDLSLDDRQLEVTLGQWARWSRKHPQLSFCFDRDRVHLAEGLQVTPEGRSAIYQQVGIRLYDLYERLGRGCDDETLFERLGLLCESAVRAGVQKREFLRRQQPDFFAGRDYRQAAVVVVPIGLDAMVEAMIGKPMGQDEAAMAFAEQILLRMRHRLQRAGRHYQLRCKIDGIAGRRLLREETLGLSEEAQLTIGNTPGCPGVGPKQQIVAGGKLHAVLGAGTVYCRLPKDVDLDAHELLDLVHFAGRHSAALRLSFVSPSPARQAPLAIDWFG